jgi:hypothetical protein
MSPKVGALRMRERFANAGQITHVNQHGERYFLCARSAANRARYVMTKDATGALTAMPAGYEIRENVNGHVSVGRIVKNDISTFEIQSVRAALARIRPHGYRAHSQGRSITVHASPQDARNFSESLDAEFADGFASAVEEVLTRKYGRELMDLFRAKRQERAGNRDQPRYYPLLRFQLTSATMRHFRVQRVCFTGVSDWLTLEIAPLSSAVMKYIPHLGRDSFFDLL